MSVSVFQNDFEVFNQTKPVQLLNGRPRSEEIRGTMTLTYLHYLGCFTTSCQ